MSLTVALSAGLDAQKRKKLLFLYIPVGSVLFAIGLRGEVLFPATTYILILIVHQQGIQMRRLILVAMLIAWAAPVVFMARVDESGAVGLLDLPAELGGTLRVVAVTKNLTISHHSAGDPVADHLDALTARIVQPLGGYATSSVSAKAQESLPPGSSGIGGSPYAEAVAAGATGLPALLWLGILGLLLRIGLTLSSTSGPLFGLAAGILLGITTAMRNPSTVLLTHCLTGIVLYYFFAGLSRVSTQGSFKCQLL